MAKFGEKKSLGEKLEKDLDAVENYEGGLAFLMEPKTELYTRVASCLVGERKFYTSGEQDTADLLNCIETVGNEDPEFLLKLAAYARNELYLRSVPILLLCEATRWLGGTGLLRKYVPAIIRRADEPSECLAYYADRFGRTFSRGLLKGLADAMPRFNEYQLAKYDSRRREFRLRDVLRIVRPKPRTPEEADLWGRAVKGELQVPETWETVISAHGSSKETWESVIPKMGIMALIRNLRNFLDKGCDIGEVIERISDEETVLKSKQLPFRWYSAYRAIEKHSGHFDALALRRALAEAIRISIQNIPRLPGRTLIWADVSGSMKQKLSERGTVRYIDVAVLLAAMAKHFCDEAVVGLFGTEAQIHNVVTDDIFAVFDHLMAAQHWLGNATYAYRAFALMLSEQIAVDRVIFLSDEQCYSEETVRPWSLARMITTGDRASDLPQRSVAEYWEYYKRQVSPKARLYSMDMAGYGTSQFRPGDPSVALLAGWSDRVFNFITLFEKDWGEAVAEIERSYSVGKEGTVA